MVVYLGFILHVSASCGNRQVNTNTVLYIFGAMAIPVILPSNTFIEHVMSLSCNLVYHAFLLQLHIYQLMQ